MELCFLKVIRGLAMGRNYIFSDWVKVAILLIATSMALGCTHLRSSNADGVFFVPSEVNLPKNIPIELTPYTQQYAYVLQEHGFTIGNNPDPHALTMRLDYSGIVSQERVSVYLVQDDKIILQVYAQNGFVFTKNGGSDLVESLVSKTLKEFDHQLSDFSSQMRIVYPKTASSSTTSGSFATELGTAFAVQSPNMYVTAYHVISDAKKIGIHCAGHDTEEATIQSMDYGNDLAILHSEEKAAAFLDLAPSDSIAIGDHAFTVGFPTPDLLGVDPKYTDGAVSSLSGIGGTKSLMQITVPIQPGNSGGPLLDTDGRVIGVITSTAAVQTFYHYTGTLPQNISWAVPVYYLYPLTKDLPRTQFKGHETPIKRATASVCLVIVEK